MGLKRPTAQLDNETPRSSRPESEENMPVNTKKIRREITLHGVKVWITADSEQEYADKLLRLAGSAPALHKTDKHLFRDYAERWYSVFAKPNIANVTALCYRRELDNHLFPLLGGKFIEEITPSDVQEVFNSMPSLTKQETKKKTKIVLNQIFKMAVEDGLIQRNPMLSPSVRIKGLASSVTEPYSVEQMRHLAAHLSDVKDPTDRAWLVLSISLPLRPEEVLGLRWRDVDSDACVIHIRSTVIHPNRNAPEFKPYTKTASSVRDLAISKETLGNLPKRGKPDEFVIGGAKPLSYTQLRCLCKRINVQTGFGETITPRRFRTTVATDISAATHDLKLVQRMLGHSTPQLTLKHYDKGRSHTVDASAAIGKCYGLIPELTNS